MLLLLFRRRSRAAPPQPDAPPFNGGRVFRLPAGLDDPPLPEVDTEAFDEADDIGLIVAVASARPR